MVETLADEYHWPKMSKTHQIFLIITMMFGMILNIAQVQIVTVSLTHIQDDLQVPQSNLQWLSSAYTISIASLLLLSGRLGDIFGFKRVYLLGMLFTCLFSLGAAFAKDEVAFLIIRGCQGAGAAMTVPCALGILGSSFPPSQLKSIAFASFSAGAPIGGTVGLVVGGLCARYASIGWRASFYATSGFGALLFFAAVVVIPNNIYRQPEDLELTTQKTTTTARTIAKLGIIHRIIGDRNPLKKNSKIDWIGAGLVVSGLLLFTFTIASGADRRGWSGKERAYLPVLFTLSVFLLVTFWFWERRLELIHGEYMAEHKGDVIAPAPVMPLMSIQLWYQGKFAVMQIIGALSFFVFNSTYFFISLFYQMYQHLGPLQITVQFLPSPIVGILVNGIMAFAASRVPANFLILFGGCGSGLAALVMAVQDTHGSYWQWNFPAQVLSVLGIDFLFSCGIMYCSLVAGKDKQGLAGGIFNMNAQLGSSIGLVLTGIIQSKVTEQTTLKLGFPYNDEDPASMPLEAVWEGMRIAFFTLSGFGWVVVLLALTCLWGIGKVGHK